MANKKSSKKDNQVTKESNIAELIANHPESAEVLLAFGLHCVGCAAAQFDTLEAGAKAHGMTDEEIEEMVQEVNIVISDSGISVKNSESEEMVVIDKIVVDRDLCIGAGPCEVLAPKTFKIDDEGKAVVADPKGHTDDEILDAAMSCPVFAIMLYDKKGNQIYPK